MRLGVRRHILLAKISMMAHTPARLAQPNIDNALHDGGKVLTECVNINTHDLAHHRAIGKILTGKGAQRNNVPRPYRQLLW